MPHIHATDTSPPFETADTISCPHGFFSRLGGVSGHTAITGQTEIYDSLNCGPGSDDDPANIAENRRIIAAAISGRRDRPVLSSYQIHSNIAIYVDSDFTDTNDPLNRPKADAMVTDRPDLILGILTADCTPILFHDPIANIIGAAHAGWRGAVSGIIESTLEKMQDLGSHIHNIHAATGPTIAQKSYEVGSDMIQQLHDQESMADLFYHPSQKAGHFQFNLPQFIRYRLEKAGIKSIYQSHTDTYSSADHYSYRRSTHNNEPDYGRQLSVIMLAP